MRSDAVCVSRPRCCAIIVALITAFISCGKLGEKDVAERLLKFGADEGCLNDMGPRFKRYFQGEVSVGEWEETWDCAIDQLEMFTKYVKPSEPAGYSRKDIQSFLAKFMLTNATVTDALVESHFRLKASLFGGSASLVTKGELDRFVEMLRLGKRESTRLLPLVAARVKDPTPDSLLSLSDGVESAGAAIGEGLSTGGNAPLSWASIETLVRELSKVLKIKEPKSFTLWASKAKQILLSGSSEEIEASAWPELFRTLGAYGGPALAALGAKDAEELPAGALVERLFSARSGGAKRDLRPFFLEIARRIRRAAAVTLSISGGAVPLARLDAFIDAIPNCWITVDRDPTAPPELCAGRVLDRSVIKYTLRPLFKRVLWSRTNDAIDGNVFDVALTRFESWLRGQLHLEEIFDRLGPDPAGYTWDKIADVAVRYAQGLPEIDQSEVYRLIFLARNYQPLYITDGDPQVKFVPWDRHNLYNLTRMHWVNLLIRHLMSSYSTQPSRDKATVDDMKQIWTDFQPIAVQFKIQDPTVTDYHAKRFLQANLFTPRSNGDRYIDLDEGTLFIAQGLSIGALTRRVLDELEPLCSANQGPDPFGRQWMDIRCFREKFFEKRRTFWDHFPGMVTYYETLDAKGRVKLAEAMEIGARRYGMSHLSIGYYDTEGFCGLMHYLERIFLRFDTQQPAGIINLDEIMQAYPVFKLPLADFGGIDPEKDWLLEAAFTYTVRFGYPPRKDATGYAHFLGWLAWKPFWRINADRKAIYTVLAVISSPPAPPQ